MKLSIIIPTYNEEKTLSLILERVKNVKLPEKITEREIVIVDDCSTDDTRNILKSINDKEIKIFYHEKNKGKGSAIKTALKNITGDFVIIQDADLEYDPTEYYKLLNPMLKGKADVVYGSRFAGGETHKILYFWHTLGNKLLTFLSNMFSDLNLTDMETCYKAFRKEVIEKIELKSQDSVLNRK